MKDMRLTRFYVNLYFFEKITSENLSCNQVFLFFLFTFIVIAQKILAISVRACRDSSNGNQISKLTKMMMECCGFKMIVLFVVFCLLRKCYGRFSLELCTKSMNTIECKP